MYKRSCQDLEPEFAIVVTDGLVRFTGGDLPSLKRSTCDLTDGTLGQELILLCIKPMGFVQVRKLPVQGLTGAVLMLNEKVSRVPFNTYCISPEATMGPRLRRPFDPVVFRSQETSLMMWSGVANFGMALCDQMDFNRSPDSGA
eukprot:Blabericola_migrator_1__12356@NODE_774_length_6567_cov_442_935846_g550_i0_p5_GENE_NODE_774_length_6567_cov_442_935846_g550_i0NODE_774_length_6567_cov_442_935846_g550_i0_p5_ORF_typecomplete_len144_score0_22_NODE_774_length_6567_cov_442_935846_g550_i056836114